MRMARLMPHPQSVQGQQALPVWFEGLLRAWWEATGDQALGAHAEWGLLGWRVVQRAFMGTGW